MLRSFSSKIPKQIYLNTTLKEHTQNNQGQESTHEGYTLPLTLTRPHKPLNYQSFPYCFPQQTPFEVVKFNILE